MCTILQYYSLQHLQPPPGQNTCWYKKHHMKLNPTTSRFCMAKPESTELVYCSKSLSSSTCYDHKQVSVTPIKTIQASPLARFHKQLRNRYLSTMSGWASRCCAGRDTISSRCRYCCRLRGWNQCMCCADVARRIRRFLQHSRERRPTDRP